MNHAVDIERTRGALIRLQRQLFRENAERITRAEAAPNPLFAQYQRAYSDATQRYREVASIDELVRHAALADLVYVADYHTLPQAQKTFLKLARRLSNPLAQDLVIALEIVQGKDQAVLDEYLGYGIDAATLRIRIGFDRMWPYDVWDHYLPILEYARAHGYRVLALDSNRSECGTLHGRDSYAGWRIAEQLHKTPNAKIMVLVGELHLAPEHLPGVVRENLAKLGQSRTALSVHQNCEEIYWQLSGEGLADTEVVRVADDAWCVINTPPIVRQQSYLNWIDFDEGSLDYGRLAEHFVRLVEGIRRVLEMPPSDRYEDVTVYGPGETDFLSLFASQGRYDSEAIEAFEHQIASGRSFQLPREGIVYLARLTTNHAAEEAIGLIRHTALGGHIARPETPHRLLLSRAIGFFGSKILNHKRKTAHRGEFLSRLRQAQAGRLTEASHDTEVARLVVTYLNAGPASPIWATDGPLGGIEYDAIEALGRILGEQMYYGLLEGRITRSAVRALLRTPIESETEAVALCMDWTERLAGVRIPQRI